MGRMGRKKKKKKPSWSEVPALEVLRLLEVLTTLLGCYSQAVGGSYVLSIVKKGMSTMKKGMEDKK